MSEHHRGVNARHALPVSNAVKAIQCRHQQQAQQLLEAYNNGDPHAIEKFHSRVPDATAADYKPLLLHARTLVASDNMIPRKLSLEKLKKEAKDLLKQLKNSIPEAVDRLAKHHHANIKLLKLADAQYIIARENGLSSWAKLKHHIESMNRASEQISHSRQSPDADYTTLHIRCGNDIKEVLLVCGFTGDFLEVSNPFPQGHVIHFDPLDEFIQIRENFLTQNYKGYVPDNRINNTETEIRNVEDILCHASERYERIVLWYEHDSFDQLSKAYVLAHLATLKLENTLVECIQIDGFPGVRKFIGIGQLSRTPEAILTLWTQRKPVTDTMIAYGARSWNAFIKDNPLDMWHIVQETESPLEQMPPALKRTLMELPWTGNGLSLTEHLSLDILAKEGAMRPGAIFNLLMSESDPLPYLGDIMLLAILRPLWESDQPAINIIEEFQDENPMRQMMLGITDIGRSLLANKINWLLLHNDDSSIERYVGGIHITSNKKNWYWNSEHNQPVYK
ncbi:MAG: hypothetical protein COB30_006440 [Ectothiorhodospiraceae bacterium]|nr:hypothetical protein [Ectothiorhodospiraceae bacterium]